MTRLAICRLRILQGIRVPGLTPTAPRNSQKNGARDRHARQSSVFAEVPAPSRMQGLTAKLNALVQETGEGATMKKGPKGGDEFSGLKSQLAREVREIRTALKERDELLQKGASGSKQTVQLSHQIRTQIKGAKEDAQKLLALQKKEAAKKDKKGTNATQVEERQEVQQPC